MENKNIGVITEQGYAVGQGLGFNPFNENELNKNTYEKNKDEKKEEEKK